MTYLGSTPYLAWSERTVSGYGKIYVRKCSGGSWSTVAGPLNRDSSNGFGFGAPTITQDGTNLFVTWDEQGNSQTQIASFVAPFNNSSMQKDKIFAAQVTTGGTITYLGGALNADTNLGSATHPVITILNSQPTIGWGEANQYNMRQVYAKSWNGTDWSTVGSGGGPSVGGSVTLGSGKILGSAVVH